MDAAARTLKLFEESLRECELLGEEVQLDRQQMVDLDRKRNSNRECLAALAKQKPKIEDMDKESKLWFCAGSLFVKLSANKAAVIIKQDQKVISETLNEVQEGLKEKIHRIQEIEYQANPSKRGNEQRASSFSLKGMTKNDKI